MVMKVGADSRRSPRKPLKKAVVLVVEIGDENTHYDASTLDVSPEGARVQAKAELRPGQFLHLIRPENPDELVRCLVVWTSDISSDKSGEAGLEFLNPSSSPLES